MVHFDLKSANILLARDFTAKIADVGLAKIMQAQFLSTLYCVGTFAWAAPEVGLLLLRICLALWPAVLVLCTSLSTDLNTQPLGT